MARYNVEMLGIATPHEPGQVVDHSNASRYPHQVYELMCFATPVEILTAHGMERCAPGDIILHTPDFRIYHFTPPGARTGFTNDWVYLFGEAMPELIESIGLPTNTLIPTGDPMALRNALSEISAETLRRMAYYENLISATVEKLLFSVARMAQEQSTRATAMDLHLTALRERLVREYARPWSVQEMADQLNLSCSRLSVLYRRQFGISPVNDLIEIRLQAARVLLRSTQRPLKQIAQDCGFQNEYYFSRVFKERTGVSPSRYRC